MVNLTIKYKVKLGNRAFTIVIRSLVKGSLDVEYDVITGKEDAPKVAEANNEIATDKVGITIFNETTLPEEMIVNEQKVPVNVPSTDAVKCQIYEATTGKCTGDYICDVRDGSPGCVRKDDDDNLGLILGLGIGVPALLVALAVIVLCVVYYNNKNKLLRRKYRGDDYDERSNEMYDRKLPVRANTGPPTWPFIASPEYAEYGPYSDYSRDGGQRYLPSEDFHGQYDNQGAHDRDSNNYTWDYLFSHLRPGEQYQIRRPKVDYK
ncbi:uncharacterized protein LOC132713789 [Ruditapes philippinarum]|uniref:uncharacterized protein LOC132713789 n=1 Tax=Ruditapes philippinarum TaxID=129788 RepID=UPI00295B7E38|nr:uncharacterized protein LOC132713789 [Ruditapes philippinarum]